MPADRIVTMANQIARFFAHRGEARAVDETVDHLRKFWDPRMRAALAACLAADGAGLTPLARRAAERLRGEGGDAPRPAGAVPPGGPAGAVPDGKGDDAGG